MNEVTKRYRDFFESKEGEDFLRGIRQIIESNYQKAENQPEFSRDYMQRAKGAREVLDLTQTLVVELKKGGRKH